ncbi:MAG: hypothetical protein M0019_05530 [Actinomycetota bacterium]|nr:hypothetical protein [Actinomycetota bacterium]
MRDYALRVIGVAVRMELGKQSYARSKRTETVLRLAFGLAVRYKVIHRNPIDGVARLHKPKRTPTALTVTEVSAIRAALNRRATSRRQSATSSPPHWRLAINDEHLDSRLVALVRALKPKTNEPVSAKVLNTWIVQAEGKLGDEAKGGRLGWLIASSVAIAAVQRAIDVECQWVREVPRDPGLLRGESSTARMLVSMWPMDGVAV